MAPLLKIQGILDYLDNFHCILQVLYDTLLPAAQDFAPILGTAPEGDYLFFYSIDYPPEVCRTVQQTARRLHLPVYILFTGNKTYRALRYGFRLARHQTPGDFLALVKGAKLVLSTSFHGTVFALRFGTPFYALKAKRGAAYYTDPRIATLLQTAGVAERYLPCDRAGKNRIFLRIYLINQFHSKFNRYS